VGAGAGDGGDFLLDRGVAVKKFLGAHWQPIAFFAVVLTIVGFIIAGTVNRNAYNNEMRKAGFVLMSHNGLLIWIKPADIPKLLEIEIR